MSIFTDVAAIKANTDAIKASGAQTVTLLTQSNAQAAAQATAIETVIEKGLTDLKASVDKMVAALEAIKNDLNPPPVTGIDVKPGTPTVRP